MYGNVYTSNKVNLLMAVYSQSFFLSLSEDVTAPSMEIYSIQLSLLLMLFLIL